MENLPQSPREAENFAHVEALFAALSSQPADERDAALQAIADVSVRDRVRTLLAAHDRVSETDIDATGVNATPLDGPAPGDLVGAYRLIEKVGAGGMGEVFRAERADGVFTQQVAVKITRAHVGHPDLMRRFAIERQILASLNHPNIVGLLDGGAMSTGQAYLIMDYLEGEPLTRYARARRLSLDARLRLFCSVCAAVQHAHQHGIVHRDLKPANILVDAQGVPKVVDFGIAKLLEAPDGQQATMAMLPGPLTPNYASPEQLRGLPVTTASDVYALGVVLYELLAGARPYETEGQPLDRVVELVVHNEPTRPSDAAPPADVGAPYSRRLLRGDLDAIVLKAMNKEPVARYSSAGELAADLERWLAGDPVVARVPSTAYVLRRVAARHQAVVATAAVALLAVLVALGVAAWQWQTARAAQLRAEQRLRDVRQLANALIFKIQSAVQPLPGSTPVRRTIVDEALQYLARLEPDAADDPTLRLELAHAHRQLGNVLGNPAVPNLGDRVGAIAQYERSLLLLAPLVDTRDHFDVASAFVESNVTLANLYAAGAARDKALAAARRALDFITAYRSSHPVETRIEMLVGAALFSVAGKVGPNEVIDAWLRTLDHYEKMLAASPDDPQLQRNVALVGKYLGGELEGRRELAAARRHYQRSLELDAARLKAAPDRREVQFDAAISYSNVASVAEKLGDTDAARQLFDHSIRLRRQISEADPADVLAAGRLGYILWRVAQFYSVIGEPERGLPLAREAVDRLEQLRRKTEERYTDNDLAEALRMSARLEHAAGDPQAGCAAMARLRRLMRETPSRIDEEKRERIDRFLNEQNLCRE
jgi:non-specific serine/threonine protein kinase/serine/threonine-protein kinase